MMRRARGARHVLTLVCVLGLLGGAAPAHAAFTKKALVFDVAVGPGKDTTCAIQADLYTPDGASAAHPVPAILATNGFGGSKADYEKGAATYADRGYALLAYS